jgi:NitT/TauT family transport system substrate-binding protein
MKNETMVLSSSGVKSSSGMRRRSFAAMTAMAAAALALPRAARAQSDKVIIAFTPTAALEGVFNAQAQGFFKNHGLDTELLMQSNSVGVIAAIQSGSAQIGSAASGVVVGAVQHGLDYVALGCQSLFGPGTNVLGVVVRKGVDIVKPSDFIGKRVAVPGISGGSQIQFLEWLYEKGVDATQITFVEVSYPQQADILRGRTVDAVVTSEPWVTRIVSAGLGTVYSRLNDTKYNLADAFFVTTRAWAAGHAKQAAGFQLALQEGVNYAAADPKQTAENAALYLQQKVAIVQQAGPQNLCGGDLQQHIDAMNTVMTNTKVIRSPIDAKVLAWP